MRLKRDPAKCDAVLEQMRTLNMQDTGGYRRLMLIKHSRFSLERCWLSDAVMDVASWYLRAVCSRINARWPLLIWQRIFECGKRIGELRE